MGEGMRIDPRQAAALLDWWREAGVDAAVQTPAPSWRSLAKTPMPAAPEMPPVPRSPDERPEPPPPISVPAPDLPTQPDAIRAWLEARSERIGARHVGEPIEAEARLAILVARPLEAEVGIGIANASLLAAMLSAIDRTGASVSFLDPAFRDGQSEREPVEEILSTAARRMIASCKPERLLLFGDGAARALLGEPLAKARGRLHRVESVPTVATFHPRWLMGRPQDKRLAWEDLQILMESE